MKVLVAQSVQLFVTPCSVARQAPQSMGFSRQEYWSGVLFPSPWDLSNSGIEPTSAVSPVLAGRFYTIRATEEAYLFCYCYCCYVALVVSNSVRPHRWQPTRLPVPRILQARTLEWIAISFSNARKRKAKVKLLSPVWVFVTPWTVAYQTPQSMGFSRQEYWSGLPFPSPGDLPDPGIKPRSPIFQADALTSEPPGKP